MTSPSVVGSASLEGPPRPRPIPALYEGAWTWISAEGSWTVAVKMDELVGTLSVSSAALEGVAARER